MANKKTKTKNILVCWDADFPKTWCVTSFNKKKDWKSDEAFEILARGFKTKSDAQLWVDHNT